MNIEKLVIDLFKIEVAQLDRRNKLNEVQIKIQVIQRINPHFKTNHPQISQPSLKIVKLILHNKNNILFRPGGSK